ncbi:MAG: antibiotic biosynthesis monooxygenase [Gammaproteobacteria bacterium]|nr:antibiotic biosynthesis monooxygenase [Gammaproteobacteria bacterium]
MTCLIARVKLKPGREDDFARLEREFSRLEHERQPGTLVYDVLRQRNDPLSCVIYVRFRDEAAYKAHQSTEHYQRLVPQILETLGEQVDVQILDSIG